MTLWSIDRERASVTRHVNKKQTCYSCTALHLPVCICPDTNLLTTTLLSPCPSPCSPCRCPWRGRPCTSSRTGRSWWRSRWRWSRWWNSPVRAATGHSFGGFSWLVGRRWDRGSHGSSCRRGSSRLPPPLSLPHPHTTQSMGGGQ